MKPKRMMGQPSWRVATKTTEAFLTESGGHLGPVTFKLNGRKITPFSVAPWWNEKLDPPQPPIIQVLRGDFFCMPFGGNAKSYRGERHVIHGDTANLKWKLQSIEKRDGIAEMHASLQTRVRRGRVDKWVRLVEGEG